MINVLKRRPFLQVWNLMINLVQSAIIKLQLEASMTDQAIHSFLVLMNENTFWTKIS